MERAPRHRAESRQCRRVRGGRGLWGGGRESGFWGGEEEVEVVVVVMLEEDEGVDKGLAAWCSEDREDRQTGQTA